MSGRVATLVALEWRDMNPRQCKRVVVWWCLNQRHQWRSYRTNRPINCGTFA